MQPLDNRRRLRYSRQLTLPGFSESHQLRLRDASVFVGGVGGLGGPAAIYLAAAGVGRLVIAHYGVLDEPDLNRQILMSDAKLGTSRVVQAKDALLRLDPGVDVVTSGERLTPETAPGLIAGCDIALSARPTFPERRALAEACFHARIPCIDGAMSGMSGHLFTMIPGETACYACFCPKDDPSWEEFGFPVLGAFSGMLGCIAAIEAVKLLTGWDEPLRGEVLWYSADSHETVRATVPRRPGCPLCGGRRSDG